MDIAQELELEHSKKNTLRIVKYIGEDKRKYADLWKVFTREELRIKQRAAWVVTVHFDSFPISFQAYRQKAINHLSLDIHQASQRALLKPLFLSPLVKDPGLLVSKCFVFLNDPAVTVAPKMWSMKIIDKVAQTEPLLYSELKLTIEHNLPFATAGFKSAAHKILTKISGLNTD